MEVSQVNIRTLEQRNRDYETQITSLERDVARGFSIYYQRAFSQDPNVVIGAAGGPPSSAVGPTLTESQPDATIHPSTAVITAPSEETRDELELEKQISQGRLENINQLRQQNVNLQKDLEDMLYKVSQIALFFILIPAFIDLIPC